MNYVNLCIEDVKKETQILANHIQNEYPFDLIIYIAKGAFLIGEELSRITQKEVIEVFATREGNKWKEIAKPILQLLPKSLKVKLRTVELQSGYHGKKNKRKVSFNSKIWIKHKKCRRILLVDDAVDTGNTLYFVKEAVEQYFCDSQVKTAAFTVFSASKERIEVDFSLYYDTIISGPWANDSKENKAYRKLYQEFKERKGF